MSDTRKIRLLGFDARKAAQLCAYFAKKSGGHIEKLKLIKLVYLAEREFIARHRHPMLYDELFSLPNGPICSSTLNGINGAIDQELWSKFLVKTSNKDVELARDIGDVEFDAFSRAELSAINTTWDAFGFMSSAQIRTYTHKNCPEYTEIGEGRLPISYKGLMEALGIDNAGELDDEILEFRRVQGILAA